MTMTRTVRRKLGDPVTPEMIERLKLVAAMPDELINTSDIPEWTPEQFDEARSKRALRAQEQGENLHKKAS